MCGLYVCEEKLVILWFDGVLKLWVIDYLFGGEMKCYKLK